MIASLMIFMVIGALHIQYCRPEHQILYVCIIAVFQSDDCTNWGIQVGVVPVAIDILTVHCEELPSPTS